MSHTERRIVGNDFFVYFDRLLELTVVDVGVPSGIGDDGRKRIELMGAIAFVNGLLRPATDIGERLREPLVRRGVAGVKLQGLPELSLAAGKIEFMLHLGETEVSVRARERGIKLQG